MTPCHIRHLSIGRMEAGSAAIKLEGFNNRPIVYLTKMRYHYRLILLTESLLNLIIVQEIFRDLRRRASLFVWPSLSICVLGYFIYHFIQGDRGILAWQTLDTQLSERRAYLAELQANHQRLEHRVKLLRQHICPDLLEEQAKQVLGYIHPHEMIIRHNDITP